MDEKQFVENLRNLYIGKYPYSEALTLPLEKWLSGYTGEQIGQIHEHYLKSSKSQFSPTNIGVFEEITREHGISKDDEYFYYYLCVDCQTIQSIRTAGCIDCRSKKLIVYASREKKNIKPVKPHCFACGNYKRKPQGPSCIDWGVVDNMVISREGRGSQSARSICNDCLCKYCCAEEYAQKNNDKDRLNGLSGNGDFKLR